MKILERVMKVTRMDNFRNQDIKEELEMKNYRKNIVEKKVLL